MLRDGLFSAEDIARITGRSREWARQLRLRDSNFPKSILPHRWKSTEIIDYLRLHHIPFSLNVNLTTPKRKHVTSRSESVGKFIVEHNASLSKTAEKFKICQGTVVNDLKRLEHLNPLLFQQVRHVVQKHRPGRLKKFAH